MSHIERYTLFLVAIIAHVGPLPHAHGRSNLRVAQATRPAPEVGDAGESCRSRSDCRSGLRCVAHICRSPHEGTTCGANTDCRDGLVCRNQSCLSPYDAGAAASAPVVAPLHGAPPPPAYAPHAQGSYPPATYGYPPAGYPVSGHQTPTDWTAWRAFTLSGTHFFTGLSVATGATYFELSDGYDSYDEVASGLAFALHFGVLFDRFELSLELAPKTNVPHTDLDSQFSLLVNVGYYIHLKGNFYWPLRAGIGFLTGSLGDYLDTSMLYHSRVDLLGFAYKLGHIIFEFNLPSMRHTTDFDSLQMVSWLFGAKAMYVF